MYTDSFRNLLINRSFVPGGMVIPSIVYQCYSEKYTIPKKVDENFLKYANGYSRIVYNNSEISNFLQVYFDKKVVQEFWSLNEGAHKADLFRYAILYVWGGIYIDIKTELLMPLRWIINEKYVPPTTYSVLSSMTPGTIFQGIIASPKGNPIFLSLIKQLVDVHKPINRRNYHLSCREFYRLVCESTNTSISIVTGLNEALNRSINSEYYSSYNFNYHLFEETRHPIEECWDGADRYKSCSFIFKGPHRIFKQRYSDYPEKWIRQNDSKLM